MSILVLDIGTTSMRGILYGSDGRKLAVSQLPNRVRFLPEGLVEEDPRDFSGNAAAIVREIAGSAPEGIEAVAITSQRSSIIPVDENGVPLMDAIMWQDVRNSAICREIAERNPDTFSKTGSRVNTVFSGSKMTWVRRERPDIYGRVAKFVNIPEYIAHCMCGVYASDYTYASRSGLMNLCGRVWDEELLDLYEVERGKLCELHEVGSVIGRTTAQFEAETGLPARTPVIHAGGDQQCASIGQGVTCAGDVAMVLGTGGFLMAACDGVPDGLTDDVICNCSSVAGEYMIEANILAMSAAYDWLGHELCGMETIDYDCLERQIAAVDGITDCLVIPYLKGRGVPDWNAGAKATIAGITLATTRGEMLKAFVEGLFLEFRNQLDTFARYVPLRRIYVSGGMTKSHVLNQLLADVLGRELIRRDDSEATARGAFLVALAGLGHYRGVDEAIRALSDEGGETLYRPDPAKSAAYAKKQRRMNDYYEKSLAFF